VGIHLELHGVAVAGTLMFGHGDVLQEISGGKTAAPSAPRRIAAMDMARDRSSGPYRCGNCAPLREASHFSSGPKLSMSKPMSMVSASLAKYFAYVPRT